MTVSYREECAMGLLSVILIFTCLCVDNMVSANMSANKMKKENKSVFSVKMALFFAGANVLMLGLGYLFSKVFFHSWVYFAHHWVAFAFLLLLGIKLMLESIEKSPSFSDVDAGHTGKLVKVSALIGLNYFLAGYALETMGRSFFPEVLILLILTFVLTLLGTHLGGGAEQNHKSLLIKRVELVAGIVLIIMGIRLIII